VNWEQPCGEEFGGTGGWKTECKPAMCACSPESQSYSGLHQKQCGQQVEGGGSPPLLSCCEVPHVVLHPALGPQHKKDMDLLEQVQRRARRLSGGWSVFPTRTGWESWGSPGRPYCGLSAPKGVHRTDGEEWALTVLKWKRVGLD